MKNTLVKPRLFSNNNKIDNIFELDNNKPTLPPNLQSFRPKVLSGKGYVEYK